VHARAPGQTAHTNRNTGAGLTRPSCDRAERQWINTADSPQGLCAL